MSSKPSKGFLKGLLGALIGMNAFAVFVVVMSFVLGFGTSALRWQWVWQSGLSLTVLATLLVMVRQAERREDLET